MLREKLNRKKKVRWGGFRSLQPFHRDFGAFEGTPVDRFYIEDFLESEALCVSGDVLEIAETRYTEKFGQKEFRAHSLQLENSGGDNEIVGDLVTGEGLRSHRFDCIIFTQTLPFIYDYHSALENLKKMLKPKGVLLVTLSGISQISRYDMDRWGDYWRFTNLSAKKVFEDFFPIENICIKTYGNVLTATAFIQGIVSEELLKEELLFRDPDYEVSICVKAVAEDY